ncbi:Transcriptional regulatory protein ASH1 [Nakaseomyces bracarensis]|uniref:Transcriptional regulatory protein ASH1 n=1 Tax=Nakaseomyces bracarensis TaxID=273131 RepID=A0ABR4NNH5_9SACH
MSVPLNDLSMPILGNSSFSSNHGSYVSSAGSEGHLQAVKSNVSPGTTVMLPQSTTATFDLHGHSHSSPASRNYSYFSSPIPSSSKFSLNTGKLGLARDSATVFDQTDKDLLISKFTGPSQFLNGMPFRKSNTAPASPNHFNGNNYISALTPSTSPPMDRKSLTAKTSLFYSAEKLNTSTVPNLLRSSTFQESLDRVDANVPITQPHHVYPLNRVALPSLRHLQLLPDPSVQENSKLYADTARVDGRWRQNLVHWCKEKSYEDYVKIQEEVSKVKTQFPISQLRNSIGSSESVGVKSGIPSILNPKDQFEKLSNSPWTYEAPVTPPMSPSSTKKARRQNSNENMKVNNPIINQTPKTPGDDLKEFTPIISEKLIQTVRTKQYENYNNGSSPSGHKKTNSFKALQIKRLLDNRDVLSINSRAGNRISKPGSLKSTTFISDAATQLAYKLDKATSNSTSPSSTRSSSPKRRDTSPTRFTTFVEPSTPKEYKRQQQAHSSRSRSRSPSRPITPNQNIIHRDSFSYQPQQGYNANSTSVFSTPALKYGQNVSESPNLALLGAAAAKSSISTNTSPKHYYNSKKIAGGSSSPKKKSSNAAFATIPPRSNSNKSRSGSGSPKNSSYNLRKCVSCSSSDSPCWRPSWSGKKTEQLCNSCGLRYKKTRTRCLNDTCRKIPTKGELNIMKSHGVEKEFVPSMNCEIEGYRCLFCNHITETK